MKSHIVIAATLVLGLAGQTFASEETARFIYQKRQYENAMTRTQVEVAQYVINHVRASAAVAAQGGAGVVLRQLVGQQHAWTVGLRWGTGGGVLFAK
jgi:hypothetical protein